MNSNPSITIELSQNEWSDIQRSLSGYISYENHRLDCIDGEINDTLHDYLKRNVKRIEDLSCKLSNQVRKEKQKKEIINQRQQLTFL